jgi:putative sigma-54 modulation protein
MNLKIQAQGLALTDGLRQHVAMRLAYALNYGRDIVTRIVVRLSDVNGPRGGEDKCCDIEVRLKGAPALIVEDIQSDLYVAIDRATGRVGHALDRHLARRCWCNTFATGPMWAGFIAFVLGMLALDLFVFGGRKAHRSRSRRRWPGCWPGSAWP